MALPGNSAYFCYSIRSWGGGVVDYRRRHIFKVVFVDVYA